MNDKTIDLEYAIKQDVRNNPVVREVDTQQRREIRRAVWLAGLGVAMMLFSAWQHFEMVKAGYAVEQLRLDLAHEEAINRRLRLNLETLRTPQQIERRAIRELGLQYPASRDMVVLERVPVTLPSSTLVAQAH